MELSGYYFRGLLKKTRRRFALTASEQALYQELVDICNEESWNTSFQVSNGELLNNLQCTETSLRTWRQSLVNAGLIKYASGKSKRSFGVYTLVLKINANPLPKAVPNPLPKALPNSEDYNKLKETKSLYIVIANENRPIENLSNLFEMDAGLKMIYAQKGLPAGEFLKCVETWVAQNHAKEYPNFTDARKHFLFWMPNFGYKKDYQQKNKFGNGRKINVEAGKSIEFDKA